MPYKELLGRNQQNKLTSKPETKEQTDQTPVIIGLLVDVSGSMRESIKTQRINKNQYNRWIDSIFPAIRRFLTHDTSGKDQIFALAIGGAEKEIESFNILKVLETLNQKDQQKIQLIKQCFDFLQINGASRIKIWSSPQKLSKLISHHEAFELFHLLKTDQQFLEQFVYQILPDACRTYKPNFRRDDFSSTFFGSLTTSINNTTNKAVNGLTSVAASFVPEFQKQNQIKQVIQKSGKKLEEKKVMQNYKSPFLDHIVSKDPLKSFTISEADNLLKQIDSSLKLSQGNSNNSKQLLNKIEPFIYGKTPFFKTFDQALQIFSKPKYKNYKKVVFVLSDGDPTDEGNQKKMKENLISKIEQLDLTVVSCFITNSKILEPQTLYSEKKENWPETIQLMYDISTFIEVQNLPLDLFASRKWKIESEQNNIVKLFIHANCPQNIQEVCKLANNIIDSGECLSEIITQVDLSVYMNQAKNSYKIYNQGKDGICYAIAASTLIHLELRNLLYKQGKQEHLPSLESIRDEIIKEFSKEEQRTINGVKTKVLTGASSGQVLQKVWPRFQERVKSWTGKQYTLNVKLQNVKKGIEAAKQAIRKKKMVFARFSVTKEELQTFNKFFRENPKGVLDQTVIKTKGGHENHAVILVSYSKDELKFMNSYGTQWGDGGFFKVKNTNVLGFMYATLDWKLKQNNSISKQKSYKQEFNKLHASKVSNKMFEKLGFLNQQMYQCPICHKSSFVVDFSGSIQNVKCPCCKQSFRIQTGQSKQLILSLYLNSLYK